MANGESDMRIKRKLIWISVFLLAAELSSETLSLADEGSCDASAPRDKKVLIYKSSSIQETADTITVQPICTDQAITVKKCAVIQNHKVEAQRFCFPPNAPEYFEYADKLEFYI
jgi:hypothetical protein